MKITIPMDDNHRASWRWVAKTGKDKERWPGWDTLRNYSIDGIICNADECRMARNNYCFACGATESCEEHCPHCPIDWGSKHCADEGTLYKQWCILKPSSPKAKKIAAQIAELPWREK